MIVSNVFIVGLISTVRASSVGGFSNASESQRNETIQVSNIANGTGDNQLLNNTIAQDQTGNSSNINSSTQAPATVRPVIASQTVLKKIENTSNDKSLKPFIWGFASSAFQTEGAWNESRGPSIWDTFSQRPGVVYNNHTATVAADHYYRYKEDFKYLSQFKSNAFRFSISWTRLFLNGTGPVNDAGAKFYSSLIDTIIQNGNQPIATLFHWDLPQSVQDNLGGWTDSRTVDAFVSYATQCIKLYGDRVKVWLTFNEPVQFCRQGYETGNWAPGQKVSAGTEKCVHNIILAHAKTARFLKKQYPKSAISMPLSSNGFLPTPGIDESLVNRAYEFNLGWILNPLIMGRYPDSMLKDPIIGNHLPSFSPDEKNIIKGAIDFVSYNYYTTNYIYPDTTKPGGFNESANDPSSRPIGPVAQSSWLFVYPQGMRRIAQWISKAYPDKDIWITENGVSVPGEDKMSLDQIVNDTFRVNFFKEHLDQLVILLTQDKLPVRAYLAWSLLDNFEWKSGYAERFGVVAVDYTNGTLQRTVKKSAQYLSDFFSQEFSKRVQNVTLAVLPLPSPSASPEPKRPTSSHGVTMDARHSALVLTIVSIFMFTILF